jgi:hypothetical protein
MVKFFIPSTNRLTIMRHLWSKAVTFAHENGHKAGFMLSKHIFKVLLSEQYVSTRLWPGTDDYQSKVKHHKHKYCPDVLRKFITDFSQALPKPGPGSWYNGSLVNETELAKCFRQAKVGYYLARHTSILVTAKICHL